MVLVNFAAT